MSDCLARTCAELIDALGGTGKVSEYVNVGQSAVSNWRTRGLPAWAMTALRPIADERGIQYEPAIFSAGPRERVRA